MFITYKNKIYWLVESKKETYKYTKLNYGQNDDGHRLGPFWEILPERLRRVAS